MIYSAGDRAYILENHVKVTPVMVVNRIGDMYTVRFKDGGGTRVRHSRLYRTEAEATKDIIPLTVPDPVPEPQKKYRSPYDYWY